MPPVAADTETEEERRRRLAAGSPNPNAMPAVTPAAPRPDAFSTPLTGRARDLAIGATAQPRIPAPFVGPRQPIAEPEIAGPAMPPVTMNFGPPARPTPPITGTAAVQPGAMPAVKAGPQEQAYNELAAKPRPELHGWRKVLDTIGSIFPLGRTIETAIPGTPQNFDWKLAMAIARAQGEQGIEKGAQDRETAAAQAQFNTPEKRRAYVAANPDLFEDAEKDQINQWIATGNKFPTKKQSEPAQTFGKTPEETTLHDLMTGENGQPRVNPDTQKPYTYLEAYGAVNQAKQDTRNAPQKNTKEQIQAQINAELAKPKPDKKVVKGLQDRLKAIDPLGTERTNITISQKSAEDQGVEIAAQALAHGDLTRLRDISSFRGGERLRIFARAKELNPDFNTGKVDRQIKMLDLYTTGKQGDQLQSFGTFLEHAGALRDTMDALKPMMSSKILNHGMNWLRKNVSDDPAYPQVLAALDPVQKEFESYLLNNRALYSEDRANVEQIINGDLPLHQMAGALEQMGHTVQARYNEAGKRFKDTMGGKSLEEMGLGLTAEAQEGANKIGVKVGAGSGTASKATAPPGKGKVLVEGKDF